MIRLLFTAAGFALAAALAFLGACAIAGCLLREAVVDLDAADD